MRTRLIAAALAVVLAAVGTVVLIMYVRSSAAAASPAAAPTVNVLVASNAIAVGTPAAGLGKLVATKALPSDAVLPNRVTDLGQLAGKVALVALEPGEQLLSSKFGAAPVSTAVTPTTAVSVPPKLQQLTILLRPDQALGGMLKPGDTVGVFITLKPTPPGQAATHLVIQKVLVTAVQESVSPPVTVAPTATTTTTTTTAAPSSSPGAMSSQVPTTAPPVPNANDPTVSLLITLATTAPAAERIVYAAENGSIWLSKEPLTADGNGTSIVVGTKVFG